MILKRKIAKVFKPLLAPARYKGAYGGRGSGKSHFFGEQLVEDCLAEPGMLAVCIREVQKTLAQSSKRLIEDKIRSLGVESQFRVFKDKIETLGDGLIIFQGMQDRQVNNSARQNMADIRAAFDDLIWFQYGSGSKAPAPAYASATAFIQVSSGDLSAIYHAGRRVKAVGSSTGTIYGAISSTSYASGTQTVNVSWDSGALVNEALTIYLSQVPVTGNPAGLSGRNRLINGDFRINQRIYVSAATLAAGSYAHDRWKAGSGGGDYSFTQNKSDTSITIASGKSLMQVVEDVNVEGGSYTLAWSGTAQGRVAVSGGSTSGAYAASPITVTGAGAGQTITVEFNAGTLGKVQLEPGAVPTPFERVDYANALQRCLRYYEQMNSAAAAQSCVGNGIDLCSNTGNAGYYAYGVMSYAAKRVPPTFTISANCLELLMGGTRAIGVDYISLGNQSVNACLVTAYSSAGAITNGFTWQVITNNTSPGIVTISAEL